MERIRETAFDWISRDSGSCDTSKDSSKVYRKVSAPVQRKMINLIQSDCCNYIYGKCIASDTNCAQMQRLKTINKKKTVSLFACPWFLNFVLPLDHDLHTMLLTPQGLRKCRRCNAAFFAGSNRAKYCISCASEIRKKQKRECAYRRRANL